MTKLLRATESPAPGCIERQLHSLTRNRRLEALYRAKKRVFMDRPLPFVTDYTSYSSPLNAVLRRQWQHLCNDPKFYSLLPNPPFMTFRSTKMWRDTCRPREGALGLRDASLIWIWEMWNRLGSLDLIDTGLSTVYAGCVDVHALNEALHKPGYIFVWNSHVLS